MKKFHIKKSVLVLFLLFAFVYPKVGDTYPQDVVDFIMKREECDHFREEMSGDKDIDEMRDLNNQLDYYCKRSDQELSDLKNKYKNNHAINKKLSHYEENIEPIKVGE
ncbi:hypothetical protein [Pragia fontium]|uniref:Uncharacterized protein n=1 Tax=Pragia fontium DSM 5563 = ATCC 49100 TaxID=1122977 RepID=A0AAJ5BHF6_9GAMM|nr:hypothetical protein [Pragia fontium]SFC94595.1 hypothetical protein SAMN02745723_1062 [Pragia fontium DSM 5563 = ATCC 49100]